MHLVYARNNCVAYSVGVLKLITSSGRLPGTFSSVYILNSAFQVIGGRPDDIILEFLR